MFNKYEFQEVFSWVILKAKAWLKAFKLQVFPKRTQPEK